VNAERLLALFDRVADAPDAIPRLRRFVLDLAVRGKLVEQDLSDEPVGVRLAAARRNLEAMAEAARRVRWKPSEPISESEIDKVVPPGWVAARVNDTALYVNGLAFKPTDWKPEGVPIIRIQNLTDRTREFNYARGDFPDEVTVRDGDLLVSWSATLEAFKWDRGEGVLNQHIFRVMPDDGLTDREFLLLLLRSAVREMADSEHAHGLVMTHINRGPFLNHVVAIPPLAEQRRIVARVEELMGLLDRLEAAHATRDAACERVTRAGLALLTAPGIPPDTFESRARIAVTALPNLPVRTAHLDRYREAILDLAVRGKLSRGAGGEYAKVGDYRSLQNGYAFKSEWFAESGIRLLRNVNVGHGAITWDNSVSLPEGHAKRYERFLLREGDIVLSLDRPFIVTGTKVARVDKADLPSLLLQRVGRFVEKRAGLSDSYLFLWINSPHFNEQIDPGRSNGVPHISSKQVENARICIPTLAEQHRIVAKVHALMAVLGRLESALSTSNTTRHRLFESLVSDALSESEATGKAA
jgi:type I restriction enzyme, S subunit